MVFNRNINFDFIDSYRFSYFHIYFSATSSEYTLRCK